MSKFDQAIERYKKSLTEKLGRKQINEDLLRAIAKSLGPSIYNNDSAKVACSDKEELNKVKDNFLIKKLGLDDTTELEEAIAEVCQEFGSANRNKYRVVFYYCLVERFEKQSLFITDSAQSATDSTKTGKESKSGGSSEFAESKSSSDEKTTEDIIDDHSLYAAFVGLIPIPLVDVASVTGVQYHMIKRLSEKYDHVIFTNQKVKSALAALTGSITSFELGLFARYLFKSVPFFGPVIGGTAMAGFSYVSTKVIGEIFDEHFASGGDLGIEELTLQKMKETFQFNLKKKAKK